MRARESRRSTQTDAPRQRRSWRGFVRVLVLAALAMSLGIGAGCSSNKGCPGIKINGQCEKKCVDSACSAGTRCVTFGDQNNACEPACKTNADCPIGRDCERYQFGDGTIANYCVYLPYSKGGRTGQHEACQTSDECDAPRGYTCIGQSCEHACGHNSDCPDGFICGKDAKQDDKGSSTRYCVKDGGGKAGDACTGNSDCSQRAWLECNAGKCEMPKGRFGTPCPNGKSDCDTADNFTCVPPDNEDPAPYCAQLDCAADADCPTGYFCSLQRTGTTPCKDACNGSIKGDSTVKGCAQGADIGDGKKFQCGPVSLLRHMCMKRQYCNACETDADCSQENGQICAKDKGGHKICTFLCKVGTTSCPWGDASACGVWDKDLGKPTCTHRAGTCHGKGNGCDPCVDDNDCPNGLCLSDTYSGERYCLSMKSSCSCPLGPAGCDPSGNNPNNPCYSECEGGGCPTSAGGVKMFCLGGPQYDPKYSSPGTPLFNKCVEGYSYYKAGNGITTSTEARSGCWLAK